VRDAQGQVLDEGRVPTAELERYLRQRPRSRVILETCAEGFHVADQAKAAGHEVRVVPGTLVRTLGVGARRTKNDRRDARILSEVSCRIDLPTVHIPSEKARLRKTVSGMRDVLVESRTRMINCVRGWLRTQGRNLRTRGSKTFADRVRRQIEVPEHVERLLLMIERLSYQIAQADEQLAADADSDPVCGRLMTVPGVGPVTAVRFVAALDEQTRFADAHAVQAYLGLVPGEYSSSERTQRLGITKAGSPQLRSVLVQAAWSARRTRPNDPMVQWSTEIERRRGRRVAVVALARKLAGILYALWRDGGTYDCHRGATKNQEG
jgi:transposase